MILMGELLGGDAMTVDGEMFTQVSPATEARHRGSATRIVRRPLIKPKVLCTSCRNMIGASVGNEPHVALTPCVVDVFARDNAEHYECGICSTKLAREKGSHDFGVRWRLI